MRERRSYLSSRTNLLERWCHRLTSSQMIRHGYACGVVVLVHQVRLCEHVTTGCSQN